MGRVVIVHGTFGGPEENWFPWLADQLRGLGISVDVPRLPTPDGQSLENWMAAFQVQVPAPDEDTVLVGHSMGVGFILRLLPTLPKAVAGCVLASGFMRLLGNEEFDPLNRTLVEGEVPWEECRRMAGKVIAFHGSDDPYVPVEFGEAVAKDLGARLTVIPNGGHLNAGSGFSVFPEVLEAVLEIMP